MAFQVFGARFAILTFVEQSLRAYTAIRFKQSPLQLLYASSE